MVKGGFFIFELAKPRLAVEQCVDAFFGPSRYFRSTYCGLTFLEISFD